MRRLSVLLLTTSLAALGSSCERAPTRPATRVAERLSALAVPFVENVGQSDPRVAYYAPTFAGTVFVTREGEVVHALSGRRRARGEGRPEPTAPACTLTERFVGGHAAPVAAQPAATRVSLFHGNDPARWLRQVATYADVDLGEVWRGIAVTLKAYGKQVENVFTVHPGAAPETIRVRLAGAQGLTVAADGGLVVHTAVRDVRLTPPVAYQEFAVTRRMLNAAYTVADDTYGFRLADYDPTRPVVIDPLLQATYLGGSTENDEVFALAIAPTTGDVYVAGVTASTDFPGTSGGAQSTGAYQEAFVARLNASLTAIEQATYLGGSDGDEAYALAIAPTTGEVYVAGFSNSTDFPGTSGGAQSAPGGVLDAFVARLNSSLTALEQATYLGGSDEDEAAALAIAPTTGEVYVAGITRTGFPGTAGGAQSAPGGFQDGFVARLNPSLTALEQATYLGGSQDEAPVALAIAPATGEVYVAGFSISTDFPDTSGGAQSAFGGELTDGFVARLNPSLTAVDQATYLGGSDRDFANALAIEPMTGEVYVAGETNSTDFPGTSGGVQSAAGGLFDAFVARLDPNLTAVDQATYVGGSDGENATALAIAPTTGAVYVAGITVSTDFPGTSGGAQSVSNGGPQDAFVARLNASLTALDRATYLGGSGSDEAYALAIAPATGEVYVAGRTVSGNFPGTSGGAQSVFGGYYDGFIARLSADLRGCGNGVLDPGEQCDDGNTNDMDACKSDCTSNVCGDGSAHTGVEECDDGNLMFGDGCDSDCMLESRTVTDTVGAGGTVTSDSGTGATSSQPLQAAVTTPTGGTITITVTSATPTPPAGSQLLTGAVQVSAPPATADAPLSLVFNLDASVIPAGEDPNTITILKDGIPVADCPGATSASPEDPCVSQRGLLGGGDVRLTVLTSTASQWAFAVAGPAPTPCGATPASGCQPAAAKKAALHLANGKLSWKWQTSGVLSTSDFGNPPTTTDYLLCLYDGSGRRLSATAPAGRTCGKKPCWRTLGGGFSYKDKTGTPDGLMKLLLKSGDAGRGKIAVKGGGANLRLPALPLTTPVRAQLAESGGSTCWEATYSSARTNTASAFNAKSD